MRPIKFRIWNTKQKCFYTDEHVRSNLFNYLERTQEPVMQFTGLLDRNGKEIYEGDVVTAKNVSGLAVVKWEDGGFVAPMSIFINKEMEVIGNIYENPELLTN